MPIDQAIATKTIKTRERERERVRVRKKLSAPTNVGVEKPT